MRYIDGLGSSTRGTNNFFVMIKLTHIEISTLSRVVWGDEPVIKPQNSPSVCRGDECGVRKRAGETGVSPWLRATSFRALRTEEFSK